jgi:hypothetical protein
MNLGWGMSILTATLLGGLACWNDAQPKSAIPPLVVSNAGRDQALIQVLSGARESIYLRTECLTLVPAGNELAQALQRKVSVTVELPLDACLSPEGSRLPRVLMELGAVVTFRSDPAVNYRGTSLEIDGERFLYSASPLTLNPPGALVSYVAGPIHR